MATPIQPTPPFEGQDAIDLLDALDKVRLTPEQVAQQAEEARKRIDEMMRPKGFRRPNY